MAPHMLEGFVKIVDLIKRFDLFLIAEKNIGVILHQHLKRMPVSIDTKRIGKSQRDLAPGAMCGIGRFDERFLGFRRIEEIALPNSPCACSVS